MPLLGLAAYQTQRALSILQRTERRFVLGLIGTARHTVFQDDAGDANRVEPLRNLGAFEIPGEYVVAAARTDHDRRAGVFLLGGTIDGERRLADVADAFDPFGLHHFLFADSLGFAGRFTGPDIENFRF